MRSTLLLAAAGAALAVSALPASAQNAQVGTLSCAVSGGVGFIVTSNKGLACTFRPVRGRAERYVGNIRKFGLDIGATTKGQMIWTVFAPSGQFRSGALAGTYVGASGEISAGAGIGANALVGGFQKSFTLQPLSAQGQVGVNLALGAADLTLRRR